MPNFKSDKIASGPIVLDGIKGLFVTEEDLARAGDAFQYLIRISYEDAKNMDDNGYNVFHIMSLMKTAQKNHTAYEYVNRQIIDIVK